MIYYAYDALRRSTRPMAWLLEQGHLLARDKANPLRDTLWMRSLATMFELPARTLKDYRKPTYEIWEKVGERNVTVEPRSVQSLAFADLLNFNCDSVKQKPKVLIAAALSGHHATLLQGTVRTFVQDFDTYLIDWKDAREVSVEEGEFGFDEYVLHVIEFIKTLGPATHVVATCQAAPPVMVAIAWLAKRHPDLLPASMTLMGGPVDTRVNPTKLSKLTSHLPLKLFEMNIKKIPRGYAGSGRNVYPGFYQLLAFIILNPKPHIKQYKNFVLNSLKGDADSLEKFRSFYDEYFAVLDMDAKFYLDTLRKVFFEHHIPTGQMQFEGEPVDFDAVTSVALLTVEGANDHLCPPGQTEAAHGVFGSIPDALKANHVQAGVGHYGVFSGSRFQADIYPVIRDFIWKATDGQPHDASDITASNRQEVPPAILSADLPI